jgi:hypothetical protein
VLHLQSSDLCLCTPLYLQYLYNCTPFQSTDPACTHFIFAIPLLLHTFWVHGGRAKIEFRLYLDFEILFRAIRSHAISRLWLSIFISPKQSTTMSTDNTALDPSLTTNLVCQPTQHLSNALSHHTNGGSNNPSEMSLDDEDIDVSPPALVTLTCGHPT